MTRFTDELRAKLDPLAYGKRITFRYRRLGKSKKVRGRFVGIVHQPRRGFCIILTQVKWMGHYWGGMRLRFRCHNITWTRRYECMMPLLTASTQGKRSDRKEG